jgi:hypothetical protein
MIGSDKMIEKMPTVAIAHADRAGGAMDILDKWAVELEDYAMALGYDVIDIRGSDLTYERMTDILQYTKPAVLFNFGFGSEMGLLGNDLKPMLTRGVNKEWVPYTNDILGNLKVLAGTVIITYSSSTAQLGADIIKSGSPAFVGFIGDLIVISDNRRSQDIFKDALLPLAKRILDRLTIGEAVEATRNDLLNAVKKYKVIELVSVPLYYERKYLTLLGDPDWKLNNGLRCHDCEGVITDSCLTNTYLGRKRQGDPLDLKIDVANIVGVRVYVDGVLKCTYYFDHDFKGAFQYLIDEEPGMHSFDFKPIFKGET